jgi:hypothetical protein
MIKKKFILSVVTTCFALSTFVGTAAAEQTLKVGVLGPFTVTNRQKLLFTRWWTL